MERKGVYMIVGSVVVLVILGVLLFFVLNGRDLAMDSFAGCVESGGDVFVEGQCAFGHMVFLESGEVIDLNKCSSYFDGCNSCFITDGKIGGCTEMFCESPVQPKCAREKVVEGGMCGGIAGFICEEGLTCDYEGRGYPDASGTCI
ncbi:MAG: hypothetical protein PF542_02185 [Nanoarchaeota archaeon]|nr:hypothetical protein [Nanoarchaeota archaeon]